MNAVPLPVGHHSGGCESGVKQRIRRFGFSALRLEPSHAQQRRQEHRARGGAQDLAAREEVIALQHAQFLTRSNVLVDDTTALSRSFMVPPAVSV